jgi:hypothetical protein
MFRTILKKRYITILAISALVLTGCGSTKLLLNTYIPPNKPKEVSQMLQSEGSNSGFLEIEIVDFIIKGDGVEYNKSFNNKLVSSLKKFVTQTNFISISEVKDVSNLSLDMRVLIFEYKETSKAINGLISVEFNIRKKGTTFYTQNYRYPIKRYAKAGRQALPSKSQIFADASDYLAKKLIKDISPIASLKLVELKDLPSELAYTQSYAKQKNYEGAIKAMKAYKGEKDEAYYFNLAVYCEALAAKSDDIALLSKANEYYEKAMQMSKGGDEVITNGKAKFDRYYHVIKKVADQKAKNDKKNNNSMFEIL